MDHAGAYAHRLLRDLADRGLLAPADRTPARAACAAPPDRTGAADLAWARSGLMSLFRDASGRPGLAPAPLAACADGALRALAAVARRPALARALDGAALLGERAATVGPGGPQTRRLLPTADGWLAVNLARPADRALLPAWLERDDLGRAGDVWPRLAAALAGRMSHECVERARILGLPVAPVVPPEPAPPWLRVAARGPRRVPPPGARPRVLDLTALWAGPLCGQLLGALGADVAKVESPARPDGTRRVPAFGDLLNAGKRSVALHLATPEGRGLLSALVDAADVVLEAARPRALAQLGVDAAARVRERPGLVWVSITGYGRRAPGSDWVAFGDDASAAAGLAWAAADADGRPRFCGDAVADPLVGLHAALAAAAAWRRGEAVLLDLSLRDVLAHVLGTAAPGLGRSSVEGDGAGLRVVADGRAEPLRPPRARPTRGRARPLGADTSAVLADWGIAC